ncbi:MAG TPA: TauD/TfdA family dioxygenase [Acidimicrobiales bacterium]
MTPPPAPHGIEVVDLHPTFGSEVRGLDVNAETDDETTRFLQDLFDDRGLLLFRQPDIELDAQRRLSLLLIGQDVPKEIPEQLRRPYFVSNKEEGGGAPFGRLLFHSDGMWQEEPFQLLSLYAIELVPPIAPTAFASTTSAWETLPADLRARIDGLHVEHGHDATYERGGTDDDVLVSTFAEEESTITPIGHHHLRTGRTMLYASQMMTKRIVELPPDEGEALLDEVFTHLYSPQNTLEIAWSEGDLVLWDNIALQHARPNVTVEGPVRTLRKVFAPPPTITASTHRPEQRTRAAR